MTRAPFFSPDPWICKGSFNDSFKGSFADRNACVSTHKVSSRIRGLLRVWGLLVYLRLHVPMKYIL